MQLTLFKCNMVHRGRAGKLQGALLDLGIPLSHMFRLQHPSLGLPAIVVGVGCWADVLIWVWVGGGWRAHLLRISRVLGVRGGGDGRQRGGRNGTAGRKRAERGGVGGRGWGGQVGWVQPWGRWGGGRLWATGVQRGKELSEAQLQVLEAGLRLGEGCPGLLQHSVGFGAVLLMVTHSGAGRGVGGRVGGQVEAQALIVSHKVASHVEAPVHPGLTPHSPPIQRQHRGPGQQRVLLFEQNCEEKTL